jgi:hypothetical protein
MFPNSARAQDPVDRMASRVLRPEDYRQYVRDFMVEEREATGNTPEDPWPWLVDNIPWLDAPDKELVEIYYFRWYSFQKHLRQSPDGWVIDEFLPPVPWAGKFNTVPDAAGHHIYEARWLRNQQYAEQYMNFWFTPDGAPRTYSFWAADSAYALYLAGENREFVVKLLPKLVENYRHWVDDHQDLDGFFWQIDTRDGMEHSIGRSDYRPTINSYMYGDAVAISKIAQLAGEEDLSREFAGKAKDLKHLIDGKLWNPKDQFYETLPREPGMKLSGVRELVGYIPWYFHLPPPARAVAWKQLFDPQGFAGTYGPTTAERRNPHFSYYYEDDQCSWNGPSFPFATTQTLVALANLLNDGHQDAVTGQDYFRLMRTYVRSQHLKLPDGNTIPWIDEDLNPDTGEWLARRILHDRHRPIEGRGAYYNHSGFADLIITGLLGIRPSAGKSLTINPLLPDHSWAFFALDQVPYHGHSLTVLYDRTGKHYGKGSGLMVFCDGQLLGRRAELGRLELELP